MAAIDEILAGYEALRPAQEAFYQDLHRHPELSHQEHHTARRVADRLHGDGFTVTTGIGGTGVVGVLANGSGPAVLLRCELDALPLREETGAPFASTDTATDASGHQVPVDHACGHDMHMAAMVGMAKLMADHRDQWHGTLIPLFQPAEETGEGAQDMVDDGLFKRIPVPDVALAQHLLPGIAGTVRTRSGPFMSAADSLKITVYGRGGHGASPQNTVDPVVLAAMIIVRLQTVVSREVAPGDIAVVTVGSCRAGTRSNVIPDFAILELNVRSYSSVTRQRMLDAIGRIVRAECQASGSPKDPEFETTFSFPVTDNDAAVTGRVVKAFAAHFGDKADEIPRQTVSEDFSKIPDAAGVPYTYWGLGYTDRDTYLAAEKDGHLDDLTSNHSPKFLPPMQPCLRTGTEALVAAALAWLAP
ncbi:MAG: amidohydrolase [Streptosporangiaceae bacterium]